MFEDACHGLRPLAHLTERLQHGGRFALDHAQEHAGWAFGLAVPCSQFSRQPALFAANKTKQRRVVRFMTHRVVVTTEG